MSIAGADKVCVFGEVLFDHLPNGSRVLGGAPFNVAWHLTAFGLAPHLISRVGMDAEGEEVRRAMRDWGMDTSGLQSDPALPTGCVRVSLDSAGEPDYDIADNCAYDAIEAPQLQPASVLYHGTLATRHASSASALQRLRGIGHGAIFVDVNLRAGHWTRDNTLALVNGAHWVKLNVDELCHLTGRTDGIDKSARQLLQEFQLRGLLVTAGGEGARLLLDDGGEITVSPAQSGRVVDTVGAGDGFAAVMLLGLTRQWPLELTLERSQEFAGQIVQQRGATVSDMAFYDRFIDDWQIDINAGRN